MVQKNAAAEELAPHLHRQSLANGLDIIVKETPGTRVATVQIWVEAGSVFEDSDEAGITHFIEHMIFKGTPTRGPGELAGAIERVGGQVNAYTSFEHTVYHATLPARHWAMALDVLADAVRNSVYDPGELEREKKVVLEELSMRKDRPNIKLFQEMMTHAYAVHPYRLPVIGNEQSIAGFTGEKIAVYLEKHYQPENFTVVVVGDVEAAAVTEAAAGLLGGLDGGVRVRPILPVEPPQEAPRFFVLEEDINQAQLALALPICQFKHPDAPVLDLISQIIGQGETSRLYRVLRDEKKLVYGINSMAFTPHDPGMFEVTAVVDGDRMAAALEAAMVEIFRLKYQAVSDTELQRARHSLESDFIFNLERVEGQARVLGSFSLLTGDPREDSYLEKIRQVSTSDIMRVANTYFDGRRLTAGFMVARDSGLGLDDAALQGLVSRAEDTARHSEPATLLPDAYLSGLHRYRLPNGITLLVREDATVPTVGIRALFPGGLRAETPATNGAFAFIGELLPKGTATMTAQNLAEAVADMAGTLQGFHGKNTFGIKADFLARFFPAGLRLVSEVLQQPAFDDGEAEKIRPELLAQLKQQEDSLPSLAFREMNRLLFEGHPYGLNSAGTEEVIAGLSTAAMKDIYEKNSRPDQLVLAISGAVDAEAVREIAASLFGAWQTTRPQGDEAISAEVLVPPPPPAARVKEIYRDKEQVHLVLGFLGTTLSSRDRYSLEILDTVLSGQSGRLFTELRDRESLAYSLSSYSQFGVDTGSFGIYIGTSPDKREKALAGIWQELNRVRHSLIGREELDRAKNILISHYEMGLQTHAAQALEMALNETYGLGHDFGKRYIEEINAVEAEDILKVAQKYILPEHHVLVSVGAGSPERRQPSNGEAGGGNSSK